MADTYFWYTYLDRPTNQDITQYILGQYEAMYEAYMRDRGSIPQGELRASGFRENSPPGLAAPPPSGGATASGRTSIRRVHPNDTVYHVLPASPIQPAGNLVELGFEELQADPEAALRRIYAAFGWGQAFEGVAPAVRELRGPLRAFQKNDHRPLPAGVEAAVRRRWGPSFSEFGYT